MGIFYTTAWAQEKTKTLEQWSDWIKNLKEGDKVLFQMFIKRGNFCLDSQVECWRFFNATYQGDRVYYDRNLHSIKDGYATYWGSEDKWGDVFDARIVPWHGDIAPKEGEYCKDGHAPIFDENWTPAGVHRHLILLSRRRDGKESGREIKRQFPRCYSREVVEGDLLTVFADWQDLTVEKISEFKDAKFLYSEPLNS